MAFLAIDANVLFAITNVLGNGFAGIQLPPDLIEVADFNIGAQFDGAFIGLCLAEQDFQQGGLADAIVADQTNAVTAHDFDLEVVDQLFIAIAMAHAARFDHFAPGVLGGFNGDFGLALHIDALGAVLAHGLQGADSAFIAGAAGLDALADPGFLFRQFLVKQSVAAFFFFQGLLLEGQVILVVAGPADQMAPVDLDDSCGQPL